MKIIFNKNKLIKLLRGHKNLGFVPTMGALHKGHLELIKKSKKHCEATIVSIFVNKPQFNKKSDFFKYPKTLKKDKVILKKTGIEYLYLPNHKSIYPNGKIKKIKINYFYKKLCGKFRPGHFEAVVDVVNRFINIIKPTNIYLGEKDYQQLIILKDYIITNYKKIKIIKCKTVREKNGLPYSSRNYLLSNKEKIIGGKIYNFIVKNKKKIIKSSIKLKEIKNFFYYLGVSRIDYIKLLNINKIIKPFRKNNRYKVFFAYYLGNVRLIDNV